MFSEPMSLAASSSSHLHGDGCRGRKTKPRLVQAQVFLHLRKYQLVGGGWKWKPKVQKIVNWEVGYTQALHTIIDWRQAPEKTHARTVSLGNGVITSRHEHYIVAAVI